MSEQKKTRPQVPEGRTRFLLTRQNEPDKKGFIGYETIWDSFQKVADYTTPKQP